MSVGAKQLRLLITCSTLLVLISDCYIHFMLYYWYHRRYPTAKRDLCWLYVCFRHTLQIQAKFHMLNIWQMVRRLTIWLLPFSSSLAFTICCKPSISFCIYLKNIKWLPWTSHLQQSSYHFIIFLNSFTYGRRMRPRYKVFHVSNFDTKQLHYNNDQSWPNIHKTNNFSLGII